MSLSSLVEGTQSAYLQTYLKDYDSCLPKVTASEVAILAIPIIGNIVMAYKAGKAKAELESMYNAMDEKDRASSEGEILSQLIEAKRTEKFTHIVMAVGVALLATAIALTLLNAHGLLNIHDIADPIGACYTLGGIFLGVGLAFKIYMHHDNRNELEEIFYPPVGN